MVRVVLPTTIFLIVTQIIVKIQGIPFYILVVDPNEMGKLPPYTGMISMLGILFWCASAATSIFSSFLLQKKGGLKSKKWSKFLLFSGCITLVILLDDLFQIHEYYYRSFIDLSTFTNPSPIKNLFESIFFGMYAIIILVYLFKFKSLFQKTNYTILLLSLFFFVISTIVDVATPEKMFLHSTIEEGSKFLGIVTWFSYFIDCCYEQVQHLIVNKNSEFT
ncbi:MAG: hypothetical protein KME40_29480 [Komarekiella atlantica HA4396-MV6]|nr:hypothetical protein [Komarekiella atlantica HA4396-MV6]